MSVFFMDTSALIKRYTPKEAGSRWTYTQCRPEARNIIFISQATLVEAVAAFCRKARDPNPVQRITEAERDTMIKLCRENAREQYNLVTVGASLYTKAGNLCRVHQLRAYDAIQLACALLINKRLISSGQPVPIFVSADDRLLNIARAEGFGVENPNNYP